MLRTYFTKVKLRYLHPRLNLENFKRNINLAFFEPPYLESMKPSLPVFEAVTIQVKGYDFPCLENFQKFTHSIAEYLGMKVELCWAHPAKHYEIKRYKEGTQTSETTYKLLMYERDIKLQNVSAVKLPLLIELIQTGLPAGTQMKVFRFDEEHEKERYVPDHDLNAKMKELDELGGPPIDEHENPFFQAPKPL